MFLKWPSVSWFMCYLFLSHNDFLFIVNFQGLTILAFNDGKFNAKTLREILSLGPTFVVMKLFESVYSYHLFIFSHFHHIFSCHHLVIFSHFSFLLGVLDIFMMYGAYSTTRRLAVSRIFLRFLWFSLASVFITFLYVYVCLQL